jgi:hypothetical protein
MSVDQHWLASLEIYLMKKEKLYSVAAAIVAVYGVYSGNAMIISVTYETY